MNRFKGLRGDLKIWNRLLEGLIPLLASLIQPAGISIQSCRHFDSAGGIRRFTNP
jgi:hypothetical protein